MLALHRDENKTLNAKYSVKLKKKDNKGYTSSGSRNQLKIKQIKKYLFSYERELNYFKRYCTKLG